MMSTSTRILFALVALPGLAWGQSTGSTPAPQPVILPYGDGEQAPLQYAGRSSPKNFVSLDMNAEMAYDDNVFNNNAFRQGDLVFTFAPRLELSTSRRALSFSVDYLPDFEVYRQIQGRNQLNHALQLDMEYRLSSHLGLRVRDSSYYRNDLFMPRTGEAFLSDQGSPTNLNDTVFVPLSRTFGNNARVDLTYRKSRRTWVTLFGDALEHEFLRESSGVGTLLDTHGWSAGTQFVHRLTAKTSLGAVYMLQELRFGDKSRTLADSAFFSVSYQFSPRLGLQVFGGPQYMRIHDHFFTTVLVPGGRLQVSAPIFRTGWHEGVGGTVVKKAENTVFEISAQRLLTDGGGLLPAVSNTQLRGEVQRELARHWRAVLDLETAQSHAFNFLSAEASLGSQRVGVAFEHPLKENLTARIGYNFLRQKTEGQFPLLNNVNRNRVSFGIDYRLGHKSLGR